MEPERSRRVAQAVHDWLEAIGAGVKGETARTPALVAEAAQELWGGIGLDPAQEIQVLRSEAEGSVAVEDLPFLSFCPHHLLPYHGHASVRYEPLEGRVAGLGDLARSLWVASRRLILQEDLTHLWAQALWRALRPRWVEVELVAEQLCLTARGARAVGSRVHTRLRLPREN
jgi:GTP cyclohydrolase I